MLVAVEVGQLVKDRYAGGPQCGADLSYERGVRLTRISACEGTGGSRVRLGVCGIGKGFAPCESIGGAVYSDVVDRSASGQQFRSRSGGNFGLIGHQLAIRFFGVCTCGVEVGCGSVPAFVALASACAQFGP